jgi:cellulose synthase/poly-beta-1,6-N-acetylglucosamine synthase-like glycosyltransferase
VPFHRNLGQLQRCLSAIRASAPDVELIVAADGAVDDCRPLTAQYGARMIVVPGPSGPAVARNRAAAQATGDLLFFVDTDVVVAPDAIAGMRAMLDADPSIAGVFGAYDRSPAASNFMSQFKNLSHAYVHEIANPRASTFWAGLGVLRADAFRAVGGFDERFARPSVEDIDLGYRLVSAGYALRLDPSFRGCHLKRWTLWNCIVTDIRARGVPWMQLIHRFQALANDLNTSIALRLSVVVAYLVVISLALAWVTPWALVATAALFVALYALNADYYRWFAARRGWGFALRVLPVHLIHHLCNGISFVAGTLLFTATRFGITLPGTLPAGAWTASMAAAVPPGQTS